MVIQDWLRDHLGAELAAFAVRGGAAFRVEAAYRAARAVVDGHGDVTARSWLTGVSPALYGQAPALVIRDAAAPGEAQAAIDAALAYAGGEYA